MTKLSTVELKRDCAAVQIPAGTSGTLLQGTVVHITQALGNSYTVRTDLGLFRIAEQDADALGLESNAAALAGREAEGGADSASTKTGDALEEQQVWEVLRSCYDPEIPVNIVDLGLVYDMQISGLPNGRHRVDVKMTLTAPGCGMGGVIAGDAQQKLLMLDAVEDATVEIVWDPPWHQSMITAEGRKVLGLE